MLKNNNIKYRSSEYVGWEDLALTVDVVRSGLYIAKCYGLTYSAPKIAIVSGGCNGDDAKKTSWDRTKKNSELFMKNVSNGDPALYIKEVPKQSTVVVRCDWTKLKVDKGVQNND